MKNRYGYGVFRRHERCRECVPFIRSFRFSQILVLERTVGEFVLERDICLYIGTIRMRLSIFLAGNDGNVVKVPFRISALVRKHFYTEAFAIHSRSRIRKGCGILAEFVSHPVQWNGRIGRNRFNRCIRDKVSWNRRSNRCRYRFLFRCRYDRLWLSRLRKTGSVKPNFVYRNVPLFLKEMEHRSGLSPGRYRK